ncbi:hypothetical protein CDEST_10008 [Colletotrichum destructivum]|uniref:Uncharacterized protein n=1 Tax=Colletotrichum destructivum TaxID=34406 RepID=A0AAX4INV2_9PEZI|nr:hypothetical protein CDEST_10008 [Colletotrichum destructivum]
MRLLSQTPSLASRCLPPSCQAHTIFLSHARHAHWQSFFALIVSLVSLNPISHSASLSISPGPLVAKEPQDVSSQNDSNL